MFSSRYQSVLAAKSPDDFRQEIVRFASHRGFERVGAVVVIDRVNVDTEFIGIDNVPEGRKATYHDRRAGKRNPVPQHCKKSSLPIVWDQSTYTQAGEGEMWECQAEFGDYNGIAAALHMPGGLHFMFGMNGHASLRSDEAELMRLVAEVQLFAVCASEAAMRIVLPTALGMEQPSTLSARELECLRWTMEGKTAWEVGRLLNIAENTAVRHLYNATRKLGCVNKAQAVVKALRLNLIW